MNTTDDSKLRSYKIQLRIVLVLSMIGSGCSFLLYLMLGVLPESFKVQMLQQVQQTMPTMYDAYDMFFKLPTVYCLLSALLYALSFIGTILMWNLRKSGFHCYTLAQILVLIVTVLFLGKAYLALGNIMITALFIAYYFLHLRQLGAFSPDKDGDAATDDSSSNSAVTA